ncbi:MAG: DUF4233 domain-containing protein [Actinomycetes bacterium]
MRTGGLTGVRVLAASVLVSEALVVLFGLLVARGLSGLPVAVVVGVGGAGALTCLVLAGLLRYRATYLVASLVQVVLVASGAVVTAMYFMGGLFALLWVAALVVGHRGEAIQARLRTGVSTRPETGPPAG